MLKTLIFIFSISWLIITLLEGEEVSCLEQANRRIRSDMIAQRMAVLEGIARISPDEFDHSQGRNLDTLIDEKTGHLPPSTKNPRFISEIYQEILENGGLKDLDPRYDRFFDTPLGQKNFFKILTDIGSNSGPFAAADIAYALRVFIAIGEINIRGFHGTIRIQTAYDKLKDLLPEEALNIHVSLSDWIALNYYVQGRALRDKAKYIGNGGQRLFIRELKDEEKITSTYLPVTFKAIHPDFRQELGWTEMIRMSLEEAERLR